jgi:hypothetical protein
MSNASNPFAGIEAQEAEETRREALAEILKTVDAALDAIETLFKEDSKP